MKKTYGIENLKLLIGFTIAFGGQLYEVLEDRKLEWLEGLSFLPTLQEIPKLIESFPEIPKELADLDEQEALELMDFVRETFDIAADDVEDTIEEAFQLVIRIYTFAMNTKKRFNS